MCCCNRKCAEINQAIHAKLNVNTEYNQAHLERIRVNTDQFTLEEDGFVVIFNSPIAKLYAPNGQVHVIHKNSSNAMEQVYDFNQNVSDLSGTWRLAMLVVVQDTQGSYCSLNISTHFEVETESLAGFYPTRYKRFGFVDSDLSPLSNVQLIYDGDTYDLAPFYDANQTGADALKADFINALDLIGLTVDPLGDMTTDIFGYTSSRGWNFLVFANNGLEDKIQLHSDRGFFTKAYDNYFENTDEGVFLRFVPNATHSFADLSSFKMKVGTDLILDASSNSYNFVGFLAQKEIDLNTFTGTNTILNINGQDYPVSVANPNDFNLVAQAIDGILKTIDQNEQAQANVAATYYSPSATFSVGMLQLGYPRTWTVSLTDNGNNFPLENIGSGKIQTGYEGALAAPFPFIALVFNVLGLVGLEPAITLEYELAGQQRVQVFTYDSNTKTYS